MATSIEGAIEGEAEVCQLKCPFVEPEKEAVERAILDDLLDAFGALPEEKAPLRMWVHEHGVDTNIVLHSAMEVDNRGSALYIATVLNDPDAVELLLRLGADANYRHPAPHGDTPILHCAQQGYIECLEQLLGSSDLKLSEQVTRDYKVFLGQAVPQYEAGGRSPLLLAALNNRMAAAKLLMNAWPEWVTQLDSFGRTPVEAVLDRVALIQDNEELRASLLAMASLISSTPIADLEGKVPTYDAAQQELITQNRVLRQRYLADELERNNRLRSEGLAAVQASYKCLHPEVVTRELAPFLDAKLDKGVVTRDKADEVLPGVFSVQLFPPQFATKLWEEFHHYESFAKDHPELNLPLHFRHDNNFGSLQDYGYLPFLKGVEDAVAPLLSELYPHRGRLKVYHAFLVRNWLGRQASFKVHCDKSDLTINICLHRSDDLEGSSVGFYSSPDATVKEPPTEESRIFTYHHAVGRMLLHDGTKWHKTDDSTRGTRGSIIIWARFGPPTDSQRLKFGEDV